MINLIHLLLSQENEEKKSKLLFLTHFTLHFFNPPNKYNKPIPKAQTENNK